MRITGGTFLGRHLKAPLGNTTRPTADRVREGLFNILMHHDWGSAIGDPLHEALVLDAFCGTGSLAFECLSRGSLFATLFDADRNVLKITKQNAEMLGVPDRCALMPVDATRPPRATRPHNLIFLDPPYRKNLVPLSLEALQQAGWIAEDALIIAETASSETLALSQEFSLQSSRKYGDTTVHFITTQAVK